VTGSAPGRAWLTAVRSDPLVAVAVQPETGELLTVTPGLLETGRPWVIDFRVIPHWLNAGASGHFSTKNRVYSTTLGALRAARAEHVRAEHADQLPNGDTVLVVADWHFTGLGHTDDLTAVIANARQLTTPANRCQPPRAGAT
jgi:hypothetical protein